MNLNIRKFENFHILLWLIKDLCWVTQLKIPGMIMVVPTIGVALYITWIARDSVSELFHNLAVVCWISANSVWMIGEFLNNDAPPAYRYTAMGFFITGLLFITYYYARFFSKGERP